LQARRGQLKANTSGNNQTPVRRACFIAARAVQPERKRAPTRYIVEHDARLGSRQEPVAPNVQADGKINDDARTLRHSIESNVVRVVAIDGGAVLPHDTFNLRARRRRHGRGRH
jgi:hypothetical protein